MRTAQIKQLFRIIGGKPAPKGDNAFSEEGTPFIKMKDLGRAHLSNNLVDIEQRVSDSVAKKERLNLIRRGSILLPRSGSVALNHRAVLGIDAYMVSHICALEVIDQTEVSNLYAYYYLRSIKMDRISKKTTGLDAITFEDLGKLSIPLPSIDDQIRIAHLLSKVEGLVAQRKQHLEQLDDLLKSVFLKMFGDPIQNEKGWNKPELKGFGKISTGNTPPRNVPANYDGDFIEWIKTDNIAGNAVFVTPATEYLSEVGVKKARTVTNGALLVACIAGSVQSIGRAALTDRTVSFNQQINAIQPGKDVNPLYLYSLFKLSRAYIQSHATKGMKKILTKGDFEKITLIKPPVEIQNQFAVIADKIEGIKSRYRDSLTDLQALYGALSQQCFKGELDLSRIDISQQSSVETDLPEASSGADIFEPQRIELPELPLGLSLYGKKRKRALQYWFDTALNQLPKNTTFQTEKVIDAINFRLIIMDDQDREFDNVDYELLKKWVFDALINGRLSQSYDDSNNCIQLKVAKI